MGRYGVSETTTCKTRELPWLFKHGIPIDKAGTIFPALKTHFAIRLDDTATQCVMGQLTEWEVVSTSHSSDTIVVIGKMGKTHRVVLKMGLREDNLNHIIPEMEYERRVYQQLINPIVSQKFTPNLLLYLGDVVCRTSVLEHTIRQKKTMASRAFLRQLQRLKMKNKGKQPECMVSLVIEGLQNFTTVGNIVRHISDIPNLDLFNNASQFTEHSNIYVSKIPSIFWQVLYTCFCLKKLKLMHYDLHLENIAVEADTRGTLFHKHHVIYVLDKHNVYVLNVQNCLVKFYDWDFGYSPKIGENKKLAKNSSFCIAYGRCNDRINSNYDVIHFLASCLIENPRLQETIEMITDLDTSSWLGSWPKFGKRVGEKFYKHFDPEKMLKSPFFNKFRLPKGHKVKKSKLIFYSPRLSKTYRQKFERDFVI